MEGLCQCRVYSGRCARILPSTQTKEHSIRLKSVIRIRIRTVDIFMCDLLLRSGNCYHDRSRGLVLKESMGNSSQPLRVEVIEWAVQWEV